MICGTPAGQPQLKSDSVGNTVVTFGSWLRLLLCLSFLLCFLPPQVALATSTPVMAMEATIRTLKLTGGATRFIHPTFTHPSFFFSLILLPFLTFVCTPSVSSPQLTPRVHMHVIKLFILIYIALVQSLCTQIFEFLLSTLRLSWQSPHPFSFWVLKSWFISPLRPRYKGILQFEMFFF